MDQDTFNKVQSLIAQHGLEFDQAVSIVTGAPAPTAQAQPTAGAPMVGLNAVLAEVAGEIEMPTGATLVLTPSPAEVIRFASKAVDPVHGTQTFDFGWIKPDTIGLIEARVLKQNYSEGHERFGQKFYVLEFRAVLGTGSTIGFYVDGQPVPFEWAQGRGLLAGRNLTLYTETMGANEAQIQRLQALLSSKGWAEVELDQVQGAPILESKRDLIWRLGPATGQRNGRAHYRSSLDQPLTVNSISLRSNTGPIDNPNQDPYTDPLAGLLDGVKKDLDDSGFAGSLDGLDPEVVKERKARVGNLSTAITGITHRRQENGMPDVNQARIPKRASCPSITIEGVVFDLLQDPVATTAAVPA